MKIKHLFLLGALSATLFISSCLDSTDSTTPSDNIAFKSLSVSYKGTVVTSGFSVVKSTTSEIDTIMNVDSIAYGTKIDSLKATFTFVNTYGIRVFYPNNDSITLAGGDTLRFSRQPLRLRNYYADKKTYKEYVLQLNVHKIKPELYVWNQLGTDLLPENIVAQKSIVRNDTIFYYSSDGTKVSLQTSVDGLNWTQRNPVGIPDANTLSDLTLFEGKFFFSRDGGNIYSSYDGINWFKKTVSLFEFTSLLFNFKAHLWSVVKYMADDTYRFAFSSNGIEWSISESTIPNNFPVSQFSALTFDNRFGKSRVLVLGGYNARNEYVKSNWTSEDGSHWINLASSISDGRYDLDSLVVGASIISYDSKIFMFGMANTTFSNKSYFRQSINEGINWTKPDTLLNRIAVFNKDGSVKLEYPIRTNQSVVVNSKNQIFIFGGDSASVKYRDVWVGKLNRKYFIIQ